MVATTSVSERAYAETALTRSSSVEVVVMGILSATYDARTVQFSCAGTAPRPRRRSDPSPGGGDHAAAAMLPVGAVAPVAQRAERRIGGEGDAEHPAHACVDGEQLLVRQPEHGVQHRRRREVGTREVTSDEIR